MRSRFRRTVLVGSPAVTLLERRATWIFRSSEIASRRRPKLRGGSCETPIRSDHDACRGRFRRAKREEHVLRDPWIKTSHGEGPSFRADNEDDDAEREDGQTEVEARAQCGCPARTRGR